MDRRAPRLVLAFLALMLVLAGLLDRPVTGGAAGEWETGAYRDTRLDSAGEMPGSATSGSAGLTRGGPTPRDVAVKLEQAGVVRPRLVPGDRALLVARYAVATAAPVDVRETRTIRFNDQVLVTRENVVKRAPGLWRSHYEMPVPPGAVEGLYAITTRVEPLTGTRSTGSGVEEKSTIFSVERQPRSPSGAAGGDNELRVTLWTERTRYRIGEAVTFYFEANRDGYIMLVNAGTSGVVTQLYPNRYSGGHAVKAKLRYSIPRQEDTYTMNVSGPPGIDLVYALFTLQPIKFAETDFSRTRSIFPSMADRTGPLTRDINLAVKESTVEQRARDTLELEIVP
jgi:hypothetical protein